MSISVSVRLKSSDLYDYNMHHTYTSLSGIIGTIFGLALIVLGIWRHVWLIVAAGGVLLVYLPVTLFLDSKRQFIANPDFRAVMRYTFDDEGIHVSRDLPDEAAGMRMSEDLADGAAGMRAVGDLTDDASGHEPVDDLMDNDNDAQTAAPWDAVYRVASTLGSLVIYTSRVNASILPKRELGDDYAGVLRVISAHVPPRKMKVRG